MAVELNMKISASTIIFLILNILILSALIFLVLQITNLKDSIDHQNKILHDFHKQIEINDHFEEGVFENHSLPKKRLEFHKDPKFHGSELKHSDSKMKSFGSVLKDPKFKNHHNPKRDYMEFHKDKPLKAE